MLLRALPLLLLAVPAQAQAPDDAVQERAARLEAVQADLENARARREALTAEIAALENDRVELTRALVAVAKRRQEVEGDVAVSETQLADLEQREAVIARKVAGKRDTLTEVLAGLQRLGADPPPALAVTPDDAVASVRSSILLGAVVPQIRAEAAALQRDLAAFAAVRRQIASARERLRKQLETVADDETRLNLLLKRKQKLAGRSRAALLAEQRRAAELADRARSLSGLITTLEQEIVAAREAAEAARAADERRAEREAERLAAAKAAPDDGAKPLADGAFANAARLEPAIAFSKAQGLLPRPAAGRTVHTFGAKLSGNAVARNMAIRTPAGARVRAPADGWVLFAAPFRSYGHLLILNAGDDYHVVLMGLAATDVAVGQFVLAGEPVGRMGTGVVPKDAPVAIAEEGDTVTQRSLAKVGPVLYVEFRENGTPVDPAPWWAPEPDRPAADRMARAGGVENGDGRVE